MNGIDLGVTVVVWLGIRAGTEAVVREIRGPLLLLRTAAGETFPAYRAEVETA